MAKRFAETTKNSHAFPKLNQWATTKRAADGQWRQKRGCVMTCWDQAELMRELLITTGQRDTGATTRQKRNTSEGAKKAAKAKTRLALNWHCQGALISSGCEESPKESQDAGSQHSQEIATEYENWQTKRGKDPAKGKTVKPKATKPNPRQRNWKWPQGEKVMHKKWMLCEHRKSDLLQGHRLQIL